MASDACKMGDASFEERRVTRRALAKLRLANGETNEDKEDDKEAFLNGISDDEDEQKENLIELDPAGDTKMTSLSEMSEESKKELEQRLATFEHLTENVYLCERKINRQSVAMECDCVVPSRGSSRRLGCLDQCLNRMLMIECSKECSLGALCGNRKFQKCDNASVEVFKTESKGFGLRALQDLPPDEFIMEYVGEVLDARKFERRARKYAKQDVKHFYFMALSGDLCIDASNKGNISRFINHSCDPNCETQKWTVNGELRVGFFTKTKVLRGEELTFDYKYERYGQQAQKCYCGADNCRGWLGGDPADNNDDTKYDVEDDDEESYSSSSSEDIPSSRQQKRRVKIISKAKTNVRPGQRKRRVRQRAPRKIKNYDAKEVKEAIDSLLSTGIRTKDQTILLCRRMVHATDLQTRSKLAELLINADTPCRRLFLDYRGLKLIQGWMPNDSIAKVDRSNVALKLIIEDCLENLNIPHRTMLVESKVLQHIEQWADAEFPENLCNGDVDEMLDETTLEKNFDTTQGPNSRLLPDKTSINGETESSTSPDSTEDGKLKLEVGVHSDSLPANSCVDESSVTEKATESVNSNIEGNEAEAARNDESKLSSDSSETKVQGFEAIVKVEPNETDESSLPNGNQSPVPCSLVKTEASPSLTAVPSESCGGVSSSQSNLDVKTSVEHIEKEEAPSSMMLETEKEVHEKLAEMLESVSKAEDQRKEKAEAHRVLKEQFELVRERARNLLSRWSSLKEEFKIPKLDQIKLRTEHEQEADREAAVNMERSLALSSSSTSVVSTHVFPITGGYVARPSSSSRISRFNIKDIRDCKGEMNRNKRRELFRKRTECDEEEKRKRALWQQQHDIKCCYLGLDPTTTAMFPQHPEYYYDVNTNQWLPMPPPDPAFDLNREYPIMALLPLCAFNPGEDPNLPDPTRVYPPGVVLNSRFFENLQEETSEEAQGEGTTVPDANDDQKNSLQQEQWIPSTEQPLSLDPSLLHDQEMSLESQTQTPVPSKKRRVEVRLPPHWRMSQDEKGRAFYYNKKTKATQWEPPGAEEQVFDKLVDFLKTEEVEIETASVASEDGDDKNDDNLLNDEDDASNGAEEEEEGRREAEIEILSSDLSSSEKALLLAKNKSREERQHERRQKREQNRERNEYERKKRRERHTKHRRDGLVKEHLIPKRSKNDRDDLMTLEEMRQRLANRDLIREQQELEEQMEEEREQMLLRNAEAKKEKKESLGTTMAAADTSSEVAKKIKENFMKESSKVIVKALTPYMHEDCTRGRVVCKEDFKYLAKKLTTCVMSKELKRCERIEQLNCSDSVKKKTAEFVVKYMSQFGSVYKPKRERGEPGPMRDDN